ncbi:MAG: FecR family protein [Opitutaceae bacterium]
MRNILRFCTFAVLCSLALSFVAVTARAQMMARIVRINGDSSQATVTNPGVPAVPAILNLAIAEGASIETKAGVELLVETFPGAVATIRQNSAVRLASLRLVAVGADAGKRAAELELQRGNVISTLDPSKKAITKYGIKTPRGVAAARGTVYGVSVIPAAGGGGNSSVLVLSGTVVIDRGPGQPPISISFGQAAVNNATEASQLSALIAQTPELAADVLAAVGVVADNIASGTSAAGDLDAAAQLLASVASAAVGALPGQVSAIVQSLVGAIVSPRSLFAGNQRAILGAVSGVTDAAVRAVIGAGGRLSQAGAAAEGAARGFMLGRIMGTLDEARAANPGISSAALQAIAYQTAGSEAVTNALSIIGNVATGTVVRVLGQSGDAGAAGATAGGIGQATTEGAAKGAFGALASAGLPDPQGGFTPPTVKVVVLAGQPGGVTSIDATTGGSKSSSSWVGAGLDPVTTQTSGPTGQTATVVPPLNLAKPGTGGSSGAGSGAPPRSNFTPLLPINPAQNVSPSS